MYCAEPRFGRTVVAPLVLAPCQRRGATVQCRQCQVSGAAADFPTVDAAATSQRLSAYLEVPDSVCLTRHYSNTNKWQQAGIVVVSSTAAAWSVPLVRMRRTGSQPAGRGGAAPSLTSMITGARGRRMGA